MASPERNQKEALKKNYDTKWASLEKRGYKKPKDATENARRLKEAWNRG